MTAFAGAGLNVTPASPNRALAAIPVTVADLIERRVVRSMVIPPHRACNTGAASVAAEDNVSAEESIMLT
jgi:hypothetical protein